MRPDRRQSCNVPLGASVALPGVAPAGSRAVAPLRPVIAALVAALVTGGCTTVPPQGPVAPAPPAASATPGVEDPRTAMAIERQWLQSWFEGTPVEIAQRSDGALTVEVPREFCFDRGRTVVKPALGAVLDKVAESLRRRPASVLRLLAAPDDGDAITALATQRALQVQRHLRGRGVPAARLAAPMASMTAAVQLRIEAAASP
jgi:outer membrane protein OmpA-like peptidoglycan-associated protein